MTTRRPIAYLFAAMLLCLHIVFAASGFYFYTSLGDTGIPLSVPDLLVAFHAKADVLSI